MLNFGAFQCRLSRGIFGGVLARRLDERVLLVVIRQSGRGGHGAYGGAQVVGHVRRDEQAQLARRDHDGHA